jgi:hypothetical protein
MPHSLLQQYIEKSYYLMGGLPRTSRRSEVSQNLEVIETQHSVDDENAAEIEIPSRAG